MLRDLGGVTLNTGIDALVTYDDETNEIEAKKVPSDRPGGRKYSSIK